MSAAARPATRRSSGAAALTRPACCSRCPMTSSRSGSSPAWPIPRPTRSLPKELPLAPRLLPGRLRRRRRRPRPSARRHRRRPRRRPAGAHVRRLQHPRRPPGPRRDRHLPAARCSSTPTSGREPCARRWAPSRCACCAVTGSRRSARPSSRPSPGPSPSTRWPAWPAGWSPSEAGPKLARPTSSTSFPTSGRPSTTSCIWRYRARLLRPRGSGDRGGRTVTDAAAIAASIREG